MAHAQLFAAMRLQEGREFARVKMIGVIGRALIFGRGDGLGRQAIVADHALRADRIAKAAIRLAAQPVGARFTCSKPWGSISGW
jgi:uncharacterized membrane protein